MKYLLLLLLIVLSPINYALSLKANAPSRYVVQPGDTLWLIANRYLEQPWEWQALWRANPKIHNPNRLYVGDVLVLADIQNTPYIKVLSNGTIKLSPKTRPSPIKDAIPAIPLNEIQPFLSESLVLDENVLVRAPYVVAYMGDRMVGGQGDEVYVKGLHPAIELPKGGNINYSIFRPKSNYYHPITKEFLGFNTALVGEASLLAGGEPARVLLTSINQGIQIRDSVLINNSPELNLYFLPKAPAIPVKGFILEMPNDMPDGNTQQAFSGIIVISLGAANGLNPGDVLGLYGKPRLVNDPKDSFAQIPIPPERVGEAMVFRTFTKTSYALIVRSTSTVNLLDIVANP